MTFEERMAELVVDLSDLPLGYSLSAEKAKSISDIACRWFVDEDSPDGVALRNLVSIPLFQYILHLTDIIDRMETRLDNQTTLLKNLLHVIANADIPEGVTYEQFCLVVDSIYKAVQFAQEGWETYEAGIPKEGSAGDERT